MTRNQKIVADLQLGEELLWLEEPEPLALYFGKKGLFSVLFLAGLLAFFIFVSLNIPDNASWLFGFFTILVLGASIFEFAGGYWTLYGITNRRLIILHPSMFSTVIESYYPPDIDFIKKKKIRHGGGNLVFAAVREQKGKRTETVEIGFFGIDNVDAVEALILNLREPNWPNKALLPTTTSVTPPAGQESRQP